MVILGIFNALNDEFKIFELVETAVKEETKSQNMKMNCSNVS